MPWPVGTISGLKWMTICKGNLIKKWIEVSDSPELIQMPNKDENQRRIQ